MAGRWSNGPTPGTSGALLHIIIAGLFTITIVGIPFAKANLKFAVVVLTPFGLVVKDGVDMTENPVLIIDQLGITTPSQVRYD